MGSVLLRSRRTRLLVVELVRAGVDPGQRIAEPVAPVLPAVAVAGLDATGRFTAGGATGTAVNNPSVEALTYSEKFDRLYVAVEKAP